MTDNHIDEIKARLAAATPGPWRYRTTGDPATHWVRGDRFEVGVIGGYFDVSEAGGLALPVPHDSTPDAGRLLCFDCRALPGGDQWEPEVEEAPRG